ncbi:hypothetical protein GCK72_016582 [Caenorhabditis remanei]|uniref:Uncharacterized protein n=1 Tax=Caenorhabditis remanei TaxID=31234 RepID=A0A6A5G517_CAERE|nr:hypothetical protein GCK72_016582 [Caenorhabditis remanei]KAF1750037.1 hypothetical protein GCK72_016582 [Caenorhabditis remanei]
MTTSTDLYYETVWKSKCSSNEKSFLASWQGLSLFSHSMLVVFLPFYAFTAYCILKKTPRTMDSVKFVLLNAHCWSCYCDVLICSLITPYFFFPTISGFPVGLIRVLGIPTSVQVFIGFVSLLFMGTSLVALFENRNSCLPTNRFRITKQKTRFLYYLFNCAVIIGYLIPPFCNIPEQESAKLFLLQNIPCPTEEFFYTEVFVWTIDKFWSCYCDVLVCSLITPYFFFPTVSGFPVGFLRVLGVPTSAQVFIGIVSCLFMGTSLVPLFENRSSSIPSNRFRITKKRTRCIYYLFNCTVIFGYLIPPFCNIPEQESAKLFLLQTIPCPTEEFFYTEVFVWTIDKFWSCYCDILICSLITPYFLFPTVSGFPVGLLRVLGVPTSAQTFIGCVSLLFMATSLVALFENRSNCIPKKQGSMGGASNMSNNVRPGMGRPRVIPTF